MDLEKPKFRELTYIPQVIDTDTAAYVDDLFIIVAAKTKRIQRQTNLTQLQKKQR